MKEGVKEKTACKRRGVGWQGEGEKKPAKRLQREGHTSRLIDKHTHTQTQAKVTQPSPPPGTQTNWR